MSRKRHLKVKIKTLAAEAGIIRHEANKVSGLEKYVLNSHRTGVVRDEARHSLLAYALLRNRPYSQLEFKCKIYPDLKKVSDIALRFGASAEDIESWINNTKETLKETYQPS